MQRFSHHGIRSAPARKGKTAHRRRKAENPRHRQHAHSKELLVEFENEPGLSDLPGQSSSNQAGLEGQHFGVGALGSIFLFQGETEFSNTCLEL
ncbi:MAG: hypothetical protein LBM75_07170, partial [Myxococcales bacterium]|nr:hypothetical protein [Myxococcales bacterium]